MTTPVDWYHSPSENEGGRFICSGGNIINGYSQRMKLERSVPGDFSLTIVKVTREDAGVYICKEGGLGLEHRVYLNVRGKR